MSSQLSELDSKHTDGPTALLIINQRSRSIENHENSRPCGWWSGTHRTLIVSLYVRSLPCHGTAWKTKRQNKNKTHMKISKDKRESEWKQAIITFNQTHWHIELLTVALLFFGQRVIQRHHLPWWRACTLISKVLWWKIPLWHKTRKIQRKVSQF